MKIKTFFSTLSCIIKSVGFDQYMEVKKILFGFIILNFLAACAGPTAMIGPAYTLSSSGNIYQAALSYSSGSAVSKYTGKTPIQNLKKFSNSANKKTKNIKKQTLESDDFHKLVKRKIGKTRDILKFSNQ